MRRGLASHIEPQGSQNKAAEEFIQELHNLMVKDLALEEGRPISTTERKLCIIEALERTYKTIGG